MSSNKKSEMWLHFTEERNKKVKCKLCGQQLSVSNKSTCSLIRHMNRRHHFQRFCRQERPEEVLIAINTDELNKNTSGALTKKQREMDQQHFEKQSNSSVSNSQRDESDMELKISSDDCYAVKNDYTTLITYEDDECDMENEQTLSNEILLKTTTQSLPEREATNLESSTSDPLTFTKTPQGPQTNIRWKEVFSQYILCELNRYEYDDAQRLKTELTQVCLNFERKRRNK